MRKIWWTDPKFTKSRRYLSLPPYQCFQWVSGLSCGCFAIATFSVYRVEGRTTKRVVLCSFNMVCRMIHRESVWMNPRTLWPSGWPIWAMMCGWVTIEATAFLWRTLVIRLTVMAFGTLPGLIWPSTMCLPKSIMWSPKLAFRNWPILATLRVLFKPLLVFPATMRLPRRLTCLLR